jgi:hypothetical protein
MSLRCAQPEVEAPANPAVKLMSFLRDGSDPSEFTPDLGGNTIVGVTLTSGGARR